MQNGQQPQQTNRCFRQQQGLLLFNILQDYRWALKKHKVRVESLTFM